MFALQSDLMKALAHSRRLEIIHLLRDQELPVSDIHSMLDLPQANISQHLAVLREAGIVTARRDGKHIYYQLSDPKIIEASDLLRDVLIAQHAESDEIDELAYRMQDLLPIVQDPVCHMRVSPKIASFHHRYHGEDYYFCASGCIEQFKKNPEKYV